MPKSRKKRKPGQVLKINLKNGQFTYARDLGGNVAVYDALSEGNLSINEIIGAPVLFVVSVADVGVADWEKLDVIPLQDGELPTPYVFNQDIGDPANIIISSPGWNEKIPATFDEVQGMERMSIWGSDHVEQRIRDHYAGKTNIWVELKRPKPPNAFHLTSGHYDPEPGAIKKIDLGDGTFTYGRELSNTFIAIYDARTNKSLPLKEVIKRPVLFTVSIRISARVGWEKLGFIPLEENELPLPLRFSQDMVDPNIFYVHAPEAPDFPGRLATKEEVNGLEQAVMWDNYHVVNRLRAYYEGNPWRLTID